MIQPANSSPVSAIARVSVGVIMDTIMRARRWLGYSTIALLALVLSVPTLAQVQPRPQIPEQQLDNNGRPLAGGCLQTFHSGTTTPLATYSDALGTVLNTNPVQYDSGGRARVFLQAQAYTLKLYSHGSTNNCATSLGPIIWSIDGINPSANSILASGNTWTGSNTFNGATVFNGSVTMNAGFTSSGPNVLGGGGSMSGTFGGSPIFSGTPNFSGCLMGTNGTLSGQLTMTVATGTPPFVIASTTNIPNLNASSINGCTFAIPCPIGSTTPNTGVFTTLQANTSFTLNGGTAQTGIQGTDTKLLTAGTFTGSTGAQLCKDANGGATTIGCPSGFTQISTASAVGCTTQGTSYANCDVTLTWSTAFADTNYIPTCSVRDTALEASGGNGSTGDSPNVPIRSFTTTQIVVALQTLRGSAISGAANTTIYCHGIHP